MVFFEDHPFGGEPSNSSSGDISLLEVFIELSNEVRVCSQGYSPGCVNGIFMEGGGPSEGRSLGHVRENKCNFLVIIVVDVFIHQ